jgi:uncharacterized protein YdeI (YjbR/CyaY-like superfamily)
MNIRSRWLRRNVASGQRVQYLCNGLDWRYPDMETLGGLPICLFAYQCAWEQWLDTNHKHSKGIWVKVAKKDSTITTVSYSEALEVALCYGWIDGQKKPYDQDISEKDWDIRIHKYTASDQVCCCVNGQ